MSIVLVAGIFLEASSGKVARSYGEGILELASDSVLTEYNRTLKEDYGLFAFYGDKEMVEDKMKMYTRKSFQGKTEKNGLDLLRLNLKGVSVDTGTYQLSNPKIFREEIEKYMKYRLVEMATEELQKKAEDEEKTVKHGDALLKNVKEDMERGEQDYDETVSGENLSEEDKEREKTIEEGKKKVKNLKNLTKNMTEKSVAETNSGGADTGVTLRNKGIIAYLPSQGENHWESSGFNPGSMFLVNGYILDRMNNHLLENSERKHFFNNEVEYILIGDFNDNENFKKAKGRMLVMRTGLNVAHIYGDKGKLTQTAELAALLTPGPLAPITQLILITCWSGIEATNDLDILLDGGKVPMVKSEKEWAYNLEDLLQGHVGNRSSEAGASGTDYKGYLNVLLATTGENQKLLRTMDIMQLNIKGNGEGVFLMKDYYVGLDYMAEIEKESGFFSVMGSGIRNGELQGENRY